MLTPEIIECLECKLSRLLKEQPPFDSAEIIEQLSTALEQTFPKEFPLESKADKVVEQWIMTLLHREAARVYVNSIP